MTQWLAICLHLRAKEEKRGVGQVAINTQIPGEYERIVQRYQAQQSPERLLEQARREVARW